MKQQVPNCRHLRGPEALLNRSNTPRLKETQSIYLSSYYTSFHSHHFAFFCGRLTSAFLCGLFVVVSYLPWTFSWSSYVPLLWIRIYMWILCGRLEVVCSYFASTRDHVSFLIVVCFCSAVSLWLFCCCLHLSNVVFLLLFCRFTTKSLICIILWMLCVSWRLAYISLFDFPTSNAIFWRPGPGTLGIYPVCPFNNPSMTLTS